MRDRYSIQEIGDAIGTISRMYPAADNISLTKKASILADCYGPMIFHHQTHVSVSELSAEQIDILGEVYPDPGIGGAQ